MVTSYLMTASGVRLDPLDPAPGKVHIEDIAHALAHICRFGGHCSTFYSVAEHSLWVEAFVAFEHPGLALHALLHDAAEAYIGDIITPLKRLMLVRGDPIYQVEARIEQAIASRFGLRKLNDAERRVIRQADNVALAPEARDLVPRHTWPGLPAPHQDAIVPAGDAQAVRAEFLARYGRLRVLPGGAG